MNKHSSLTDAANHTHTLVLLKDVRKLLFGKSPLNRFNTFLAVKITTIVGSMWCAYAFALLSLVSLPAALSSHNALIIVSWIAQTFLQLVLLPIIIVGQNVQAAAGEERAKHDHETLMAIHTLSAEIYRLNEQQTKMLELLEKKSK